MKLINIIKNQDIQYEKKEKLGKSPYKGTSELEIPN